MNSNRKISKMEYFKLQHENDTRDRINDDGHLGNRSKLTLMKMKILKTKYIGLQQLDLLS